jgi:DNA/RNA endonuclease YhcR with UshA esterase domain
MTFLSLDKPYPHSPLTVVIFESNLEAFGDARKFEGTDVELSGTISEYQGKPEIILDRPDQIKIIGDK